MTSHVISQSHLLIPPFLRDWYVTLRRDWDVTNDVSMTSL